MIKVFLIGILLVVFAKANATNSYLLLKEKEKIEYLNDILKVSLSSSENSSLNKNLFTVNNSRVSDLSVDKLFTNKEANVLNNMDEIASRIIKDNNSATIYCSGLESHFLNSTEFTLEQCLMMNYNLIYFYESNGPFSLNIPYDGILASNISKFRIDFNNIKYLSSRIKKNAIISNEIEAKVVYYTPSMLINLFDKINDTNRKIYTCNTNLLNSIKQRSTILINDASTSSTNITALQSLNTRITNFDCSSHSYSTSLNPISKTKLDRRTYINSLITLYASTIIPGIDVDITNKTTALQRASNPPNGQRVSLPRVAELQAELDELEERKVNINLNLSNFRDELLTLP